MMGKLAGHKTSAIELNATLPKAATLGKILVGCRSILVFCIMFLTGVLKGRQPW
jgi:hypothetical protein